MILFWFWETLTSLLVFISLRMFSSSCHPLSYQKASAVLPGQKSLYYDFKNKLSNLATENGSNLKSVISPIKCSFGTKTTLKNGDECREYLIDTQRRSEDTVIFYLDEGKVYNEDDEPFQFQQYSPNPDVAPTPIPTSSSAVNSKGSNSQVSEGETSGFESESETRQSQKTVTLDDKKA